MIVTVAERKSEEAARRSAAVDAVVAELRDHARRLGGRYILHGSAARGPCAMTATSISSLIFRLRPRGKPGVSPRRPAIAIGFPATSFLWR